MTNYYMTKEMYQRKVKKDKEIIKKLNSGEIDVAKAKKQLKEVWDIANRKQ